MEADKFASLCVKFILTLRKNTITEQKLKAISSIKLGRIVVDCRTNSFPLISTYARSVETLFVNYVNCKV